MTRYKVISKFKDLKDGNHIYLVGDTYPREGKEPDEERVAALISTNNKVKKPLIEIVEGLKPKDKVPTTPDDQDNKESKAEENDKEKTPAKEEKPKKRWYR